MNKKIIFLTLTLSSAILIVVFLLNLVSRSSQPQEPNQNITPTNAPTPTIPDEAFSVTGIYPTDMSVSYLPFQKISIIFNEPVLPEDLSIETSPSVEFEIFQGESSTELFVLPTTTWPQGTTQLTILESTSAINGEQLSEPYLYSITVALPTLSPEELEDIHP